MAASLKPYLKRFQGRRIAVAGDFMLDHTIWGQASRLSSEAPVPVLETAEETFHPGGAGNVAANLAALGADVLPLGVLGRDWAGRILRRELRRRGIATDGLLTDPARPTTTKLRIIETARKHQVARADRETTEPIAAGLAGKLVDQLTEHRFDAVIFSDYDKGVVTPALLQQVLPRLHMMEVPVFLDPRPRHAAAYHPLTVLTPNRKEAEQMVGFPVESERDLRRAGRKLLEMTEGSAVLITRGDQGMALMERRGRLHLIPTVAREVYDVTGAGDTVIAVMALAHAAGASFLDSARLANSAAGIVVGHVGTAAPSLAELASFCTS